MASERFEKLAARRRRVRRKVRGDDRRPRLSVYRSLHHIYGQVISDETGRTLASLSTLSPALKAGLKSMHNREAAAVVGKAIAQRCLELGINEVIFDRDGFLFHGRIKAFADAARTAGLKF
jgi:large subunit ribosomal protein L18